MPPSSYPHSIVYPARRSAVFGRNAVATSQPLATQAGMAMLAKGGNAVDGVLAAAITLVVVEPTGNGLGSDAFSIVWDGSELHGLNASGRSPAGWSPQRFSGLSEMPRRGWESVTVPGAVSAWLELSERFGRLPFATLFEPAIDYAERGYHVTPIIAAVWRANAEDLHSQPGFAEAFMPDGRAPFAGEIFRSQALAQSLRLIAETRGEAFYRGVLAEKIEAFAAAHGAALNADDLAQHRNDWCGTIGQAYGDVSLHEIPPNGQGIAALMALGIVGELGIEEFGPDTPEAYHLQIEAMKLAFADVAAYVADADYMNETTVEHLLDPAYLASRARLIDRNKAQNFGSGSPKDGGTVCLSAADESGMMISYIQSNYSGFGSGVVVPQTAISLQNRGHGFTLTPGHPNEVGPSKRPFHTIIPGFMMKGGEPLMAFGLMGGPMQAQGHLQMTLRTQCWGQDPQTAVEAPRWRVTDGINVAIESGAGAAIMSALSQYGHGVVEEAPDGNFGFGGAQLIEKIDGGYVAGSDPRKDGCAAAF
jgi:gamma-glutamyltranspeptidase / glutathione hydrolase